MDERQAFLKAIADAPWDDELIRGVYADWLDEHGKYEEADRQRKYVAAERWLRAFAKKHADYFAGYHIEIEDVEDKRNGMLYCELMDFLMRHVTGHFGVPMNTGYDNDEDFTDYSDALWRCFEVVTGMQAPQDQYRHEKPPFWCEC